MEIDPFDRSDAESEIGDWLEYRGAEDAWNVSCDLVTAGFKMANLDEWGETYNPDISVKLARLVSSVVSISILLDTVGRSTARVSSIVEALKSYSFLDQAPVQEVSIPEGIQYTISLLQSQLDESVLVTQEFEDDLPKIDAYGSELNQVWTNILSNAIDAVGDSGSIHIEGNPIQDGGVSVSFTDSGHGIPVEIQDRIFDAFFTTKEPGKATGLGLHAAYDIIVNKHKGDILVDSKPGRTRFTVELPARQSD